MALRVRLHIEYDPQMPALGRTPSGLENISVLRAATSRYRLNIVAVLTEILQSNPSC